MAEPVANEFLTKRELASLCRCSERTVDRLLENGDAPPVTRLSSRRIIFHALSAREWLAKRTVAKARPHEGSVGHWQTSDGAEGRPRPEAPSPPPRRRGRPGKQRSVP